MKIFICGQKSFGKAVLKALYEQGHEIVGVAPPPQDQYYDKMQGYAVKLKIPIISDCDRLVSKDIPDGTDLVISAHSHWYISDKVLEKTTFGGIGFHPSLLPRHRGQDAVRWTIAMNDAIAGASVYWLNNKVDGGDIILQEMIFVNKKWDYHQLWEKIFPIGVEMLCKAVDQIETGTVSSVQQDEQFATFEPSFNTPRLKRNELIQLGYYSFDDGGD